MSAVFEASMARRPAGATGSLLDELPALAHGLPRLERQFLDAWLEGLLAFRSYQRMAQAGERRVLVCSPGDRGERTWALAFSLGLGGSGLRAALLAAPEPAELMEAAQRTACAAVVLAGTSQDWSGPAPGDIPAPVFLDNARDGFLPLGNDLDDARCRVIKYLRKGNGQP